MDKEQIGLFLLGAGSQKATEYLTGYSLNSGIQAAIGATNASKLGALAIKGLSLIPPLDPITATIGIGIATVTAAIKYGDPCDHSDDYFPAMSGLYSG